MKTTVKSGFNAVCRAMLFLALITHSFAGFAQKEKKLKEKYFTSFPSPPAANLLQNYRMTAIYTNLENSGKFLDKLRISGDYTRGLANGYVKWENVTIAGTPKKSDPFPTGDIQEYMEDLTYIPSPKMLGSGAFENFPRGPTSVFAKNLVWDMMMLEDFAWDHTDSLKINSDYNVPGANAPFQMEDIGTYEHAGIQLTWSGISIINNELCAVLEFRALDNKLKLSMPGLTSKGTEQYWGTLRISVKTGLIESAVIYGGTAQEIEVTGLPNKMLIKSIRELWVEKL